MADTHRFSVSVAAAIVRDDGRVLAIKRRDNGHWEPPGGVVEPGETLVQGLIREVKEETGLTVEPGPLTGVYQNMEHNIVALVFRCDASGDILMETDETAAAKWMTAEQVRGAMDEAYAIRLLDALEGGFQAAFRSHNGISLD